MNKISIIIPIYNGSRYLPHTITSILSQTYTNFEIICVDDGSTDNSLAVLNTYAKQDSRISVYTKPNGGTAPKAVKFGLQYACGDYFMYMSQDDLLAPDSLYKSINRVIETGADIVLPDMQRYYENNNTNSAIIGLNGDRTPILTGQEAFYYSIDWTIHGFALINMSLLKQVGYYDFSFNSDEYTTRLCYLNANKVAFSNGVFYYRCDNNEAITRKISPQIFDAYDTYKRLEKIARDHNLDTKTIIKIRTAAWHIIISRQIMLFQPSTLTKEQKKLFQIELHKLYNSFMQQGPIYYSGAKGKIHNLLMNHGFLLFRLYCRLLNRVNPRIN